LKIFGVFLIPYAVFEIKSKPPLIGFNITPPIPLNKPFENPVIPYFCPPFIGSLKIPIKPDPIDLNTEIVPIPIP